MTVKKPSAANSSESDRLDHIKRRVVVGIFSDDSLMERLVLKGGNAIDLVLNVGTRASVDIDLSMEDDFTNEEREHVRQKLERRLQEAFNPDKLHVFDVTFEEKPKPISPEVASFWGGYDIAFKLIENDAYKQSAGDISALRRASLKIGAKGKFEIDISRFEYCARKQPFDIDGHQIFVYSTEMLVLEKLRAICQQMPEYGPVVHRSRAGSPRARDFLDIHTLVSHYRLDLFSPENLELAKLIFHAKRVPLELIGKIGEFREFHRSDFRAVKDTVKPGVVVQDFDFYFDFVLELAARISEALRNK